MFRAPAREWGNILKYYECVYRSLQNDILKLFGPYKNWRNIPKYFNMRKYPESIRQYGMTDITTTGPKESYVKTVREAWGLTNKQIGTLTQQVGKACVCLAYTNCQFTLMLFVEVQVADKLDLVLGKSLPVAGAGTDSLVGEKSQTLNLGVINCNPNPKHQQTSMCRYHEYWLQRSTSLETAARSMNYGT